MSTDPSANATASLPPDAEIRRARLTLAIAGLAALATYLDSTILFVAFEDITASFGDSSVSTLSWVLNGFTITFAALLVPAGKLADRFGHRRAFLIGSALFTVASFACGLAPNVGLLIIARVFQGIGAAILIPASLALVMAAFPREKLPQVVAIWGAIGALSAALGPSLGALIIDRFGWRWAFFINLPVGIITVVAGMRHLRESKTDSIKVPSIVGVILIALAAASIAYSVVESDTAGWLSAQTIGFFVVGLALLGAFVAHQRSTDAPTLDLELFAIRNFRWGNITMFIFSFGFIAKFFSLILFLVRVWDWSILKAGLGVAPGPALVAVLAPRLGKLGGQIGQRPLLLLGGVIFTISALYRAIFLTAEVSYWIDFFVPLIPFAVATALIFPQATSVAAQALPPDKTGVGGGVVQALRQFGGTFGVAMTVAVLGTATGTAELLTRFDRLWWILAAVGIIATAAATPLRTSRAAT